jgi:hypothetical protein
VRLRALARGRNCQVRLAGVCNGNPETTVLAHFRLSGLSGMGIKSPDMVAAWACSSCHAYIDTHKDCATQLDFAKGVFRTQAQLIKEGEIASEGT